MKILELELTNIQSHKNTKFTFSPFLNVIKGIANSSDIGKSVVIKGLRLLIENRASKKIRTTGATSPSSVIASDGVVTVGRVKDDKLNGYFIKEEGKEDKDFKAIKTDIPHDVQKALNLSEVNIQLQRDTFFLIDDSPGQVAKELNKVSGLSTIDATLKRINSEITSITGNIRTQNEIIEKCKQGIEYSKWSLSASNDLEVIEGLQDVVDSLSDKRKETTSLVESYSFYSNQMKGLLPLSIIDDFKEIVSIQNEISKMESASIIVENNINGFLSAQEKIKEITVLDLTEISSLQDKIDELRTDKNELSLVLNSYNRLSVSLKEIDKELLKTQAELNKIEICPTCNRPMEICDDLS